MKLQACDHHYSINITDNGRQGLLTRCDRDTQVRPIKGGAEKLDTSDRHEKLEVKKEVKPKTLTTDETSFRLKQEKQTF